MKLHVIVFAVWIGLCSLLGVGLAAVGAPPWALVVAVLVVFAAHQAYCRYLVPRTARARLLRAVDPTAGPPPGAMRVDSPLLDRLDVLSDAKDWDGLRALLSDDFAMVLGKHRVSQRGYVRLLEAGDRRLPGESHTDEVVIHPDEPDVLWVRSTASGKPRFGPGFVSTTWTRVRLTADGSRVREIGRPDVLRVV